MSDELDQPTNALVLETRSGDLRPTVELLREVPEEEVWLQGQRSEQTRRAYKADTQLATTATPRSASDSDLDGVCPKGAL